MQSPELQQLTASEPLSLQQEYEMQQTWRQSEDKCTFIVIDKKVYEERNDDIAAMIGDTNLFLREQNQKTPVAEAEVMIAEQWARGQHRGWEAMLLMFQYGCEKLNISNYEVKIGMDNKASLAMFKKLGFKEISRSDVFREITFGRIADTDFLRWLQEETPCAKIVNWPLNGE